MNKTNRAVSIDIDGVLSNYPRCWVKFVNINLKTNFSSKSELKKNISPKEYDSLKSKYRSSTYKENLECDKEILEIIKYLKDSGREVILLTSRPIEDKRYPELKNITLRWLNKNKIIFDKLIYKDSDMNVFKSLDNIEFHIEDEVDYAKKISSLGIRVFLFVKNNEEEMSKNSLAGFENITVVKSPEELAKLIKNE